MGVAIFDKEFRCIFTVQFDPKRRPPEILFAERQLDQLTFVLKNKRLAGHELFKTKHSVPKEFQLTEDERACN